MSKLAKIIVKNCKNCPFSTYYFFKDYANCLAPTQIHEGKYNITSYYKSYKSPKWCPLNNIELIIKKDIENERNIN